jgi:hypothetical protein
MVKPTLPRTIKRKAILQRDLKTKIKKEIKNLLKKLKNLLSKKIPTLTCELILYLNEF